MIVSSDVQELAETIRRDFHPQKIVLFGSWAWGTPTEDSDVDLLVVLPFDGKPWRMASTIRERIQARCPLDLLVRTPDQVQSRLALNDSFMTDILTRGKVLYEA